MSCRRSSSQVGRLAAARSGISATSSQMVGLVGSAVNRLQKQLGGAATDTLRLVNQFNPPPTIESLNPLVAVGGLTGQLTGQRHLHNHLKNGLGTVRLARNVSSGLGTGLARLSRAGGQPVIQRSFFRERVQARQWQTRLTTAVNARDLMLLPGVTVKASYGQMVEVGGQSWHAGLMLVQTAQGERAMTHLQRLSIPAAHVYFDRALKDQEIVGIIAGERGYEPRHLRGFAGELTEVESLLPFSRLKQSLIKAHLLWGR